MKQNKTLRITSLMIFLLVFSLSLPSVNSYLSPVINLTGDNNTNYLQDFETYGLGHSWGFNNGASGTNNTNICKLNGCYNFSNKTRGTSAHDRLNMSSNNFTVGDGFTFMAWVWHNTTIDGSNSQGYFFLGNDNANNEWYMEQGSSGDHPTLRAANGSVDATAGAGDIDGSRVWVHKTVVYDGANGRLYTYANGIETMNSSENFGVLNHSTSDDTWIGVAKSNIDIYGYMDEILMWNSTLTPAEVLAIYNSQKSGTPPTIDIYITNLTESGTMMTATIKNWGISNAGAFNTTWKKDGSTLCINQTSSLNAGSSTTISCAITESDVAKIDLIVDSTNNVAEDNENNNNVTFPLIRSTYPRMHPAFNLTFVTTILNNPGEDAYSFFKTFLSEDFTIGWTASNLDPRAKKGWENAVNCYINDYNSTVACNRTINHLEGWLNGTISVANIQAESTQVSWTIGYVALTYDLMYNNLTATQRTVYGNRLNELCSQLMFDPYEVYQDTQTQTFGNGKLFGSLPTATCIVSNGVNDDNPVSLYYPADAAIAYSSADQWLRRSERAVRGGQGDRCPEGMLYCNYGWFNLGRILYWVNTSGYFTYNQADIDGIIVGVLNYFLRFDDVSGASISDIDQFSKFYTFGDTHPYDLMGEEDTIGAGMLTILGTLTNNQTLKNAVLTVRQSQYNTESNAAYTRPAVDVFFYPVLHNTANNRTSTQLLSDLGAFYRGVTWDYTYFRPARNYLNDTIIIFDGGDIPSSGHPNAEFSLFVSALGVEWIDEPYVPYEDDVRSEWYVNTLTMTNSTGTGYVSTTTPAFNQIYGGAVEPTVECYPTCNYMPDGFRGTLDEATNVSGGFIARMTAEYTETDLDPYRKIIVQNSGTSGFIVEHVRVNRTSAGYTGLSMMNINESINSTINSLNLLLKDRTDGNKNYEVEVLYNDTPIYLWKWANNTRASDSKTSFGGLNVTYARYEYYSPNATDFDLVLLHHWYLGTEPTYNTFSNTTHYGYNNGTHNVSMTLGTTNWYSISGVAEGGGGNDTTNPTWIQNPSNQSTFNNTLPLYDLNATDDVSVDKYNLNDSTSFNISTSSGTIGVVTRSPGNYSLNITVNDTSNNKLSTIFTWEIKEYIAPVIPPAAEPEIEDITGCSDINSGLGNFGAKVGTIGVVLVMMLVIGALYGLAKGNVEFDPIMLRNGVIIIVVVGIMIAMGLSIMAGICG